MIAFAVELLQSPSDLWVISLDPERLLDRKLLLFVKHTNCAAVKVSRKCGRSGKVFQLLRPEQTTFGLFVSDDPAG